MVHYAGGIEDHVTDIVQVKHITAGGATVATTVSGGPNAGTYFVHGNHLGSLNVLTNAERGKRSKRLTYQPLGETRTNDGTVDFAPASVHRAKSKDPETGLYFYNARYYNPVPGRFVLPDHGRYLNCLVG